MTAPSTLSVAPLLGFSFPLASAIAATPTPSIVDAANDPATTLGAGAILRAQVLLDRARFGPGEIEAQKGSKSQSHGCIRLTNWDALTVAAAVYASMPAVVQE